MRVLEVSRKRRPISVIAGSSGLPPSQQLGSGNCRLLLSTDANESNTSWGCECFWSFPAKKQKLFQVSKKNLAK